MEMKALSILVTCLGLANTLDTGLLLLDQDGVYREDLGNKDADKLLVYPAPSSANDDGLVALAADPTRDRFFVSYVGSGSNLVIRVDYDLEAADKVTQEQVILEDTEVLTLVFDGAASKLYGYDEGRKEIFVCNADGSLKSSPIRGFQPDEHVVDMEIYGGHLYWVATNDGGRSNIFVSRLTDLFDTQLLSTDARLADAGVSAISVDEGCLYWVGHNYSHIGRINLSNRGDIIQAFPDATNGFNPDSLLVNQAVAYLHNSLSSLGFWECAMVAGDTNCATLDGGFTRPGPIVMAGGKSDSDRCATRQALPPIQRVTKDTSPEGDVTIGWVQTPEYETIMFRDEKTYTVTAEVDSVNFKDRIQTSFTELSGGVTETREMKIPLMRFRYPFLRYTVTVTAQRNDEPDIQSATLVTTPAPNVGYNQSMSEGVCLKDKFVVCFKPVEEEISTVIYIVGIASCRTCPVSDFGLVSTLPTSEAIRDTAVALPTGDLEDGQDYFVYMRYCQYNYRYCTDYPSSLDAVDTSGRKFQCCTQNRAIQIVILVFVMLIFLVIIAVIAVLIVRMMNKEYLVLLMKTKKNESSEDSTNNDSHEEPGTSNSRKTKTPEVPVVLPGAATERTSVDVEREPDAQHSDGEQFKMR